MERFGYAEMFGRDRFFAIILISILVRVVMDTLFWPSIANILGSWDITFDYSTQLYSLGLVIIALTANVMWNGGFRYGVKVTLIQLIFTYILVRYALMPLTNFSIANLAIMYEDVAASIIAAPKAYIILVITAFIASRANLKYGWEFNGIMLPALLALQLMQPSKLLTSFVETAVILIIGTLLLQYTRLKNANFEGARLLLFFFNIGFAYKLALNYFIVNYYPALKVTDTFAFGYMLSTLLALKIYQKNALGLIIRATFQTSVVGGFIAIFIGFIIMFVPSLFVSNQIKSLQGYTEIQDLSQQLSEYKSYLYTDQKNKVEISQYQETQNLQTFRAAISILNRDKQNLDNINKATELLQKLDFSLRLDGEYIYIQDARKYAIRGLFVLSKQTNGGLLLTVPHPSTERVATDSSALLMTLLKADALVLGTQATPAFSADNTSQQSNYYWAFINALESQDIVQLRSVNSRTTALLETGPFGSVGQFWIFNRIPETVNQSMLTDLLGFTQSNFGLLNKQSLPNPNFTGRLIEAYIDTSAYTSLLSKVALSEQLYQSTVEQIETSLEQEITAFIPKITAKGSQLFQSLTDNEAALWEYEILRPLYNLSDQLAGQEITTDVLNQFNKINNIARMVGYQLSLLNTPNGRYIKVSPLDDLQYYQLGQGLYFIHLDPTNPLNIQVPRPLYESNTIQFASQLYQKTNAKMLLIAGAHPFASEEANVMAAANVKTLFNIVHQSALRHYQQSGMLNLQVRSHSAPSHIRPSALAFQYTEPHPSHKYSLDKVRVSLKELGVEHQIVLGQAATRGLELGTSPQTGYQIFSPVSELATLWLASDFKQHFSISNEALLQRLLAVSQQPKLKQTNILALSPGDWQPLEAAQLRAFNDITEHYATSQHLPFIRSLCDQQPKCSLQATQLSTQNELALLIKQNDKIALIYLPKRNKVVDLDKFTQTMVGGLNVFN
ncbi:poly-gamma-glutamate biosynthesis protein PgsC/CapC [Pseudoalteromonas phenolica]|nr:poly-gamma-glutamate biosynthesis protein PgsC/CapC [Pseudoalteromonas phenolica]